MKIPHNIGKYDIIDALGVGGMGTVYRGFDPTLERTVAIKVLQLDRGHEAAPQELSARFRNEARAVARDTGRLGFRVSPKLAGRTDAQKGQALSTTRTCRLQ